MPSDVVKVSTYAEPEDLLTALRGSNDDLWGGIPDTWIFRGHACADWDLLPAALRKNSALTHHPGRTPGPYATMEMQVDVELETVLRFAELANRQGLAIPGGLSTARRVAARAGELFPPPELWDLFALAQHHGIPTRFLDWSRSPLTAAYFAAHGAAGMMNENRLESEFLGIWALNLTALGRSAVPDESVHVVDPPRHRNRNLTAQDGVFTTHRYRWNASDPPICETLDETIARVFPDPRVVVGNAKMRLLTLPTRKARKLLVRLESENVGASTLFPGYDGAARSVYEALTHSQSRWRAPAAEE